jgi:hypothetical protein
VLLDTSFVVEALLGSQPLHGPSYDAVHVASAVSAHVSAIVTTDAGFASAPATMVDLLVDASRVSVCRGRRK